MQRPPLPVSCANTTHRHRNNVRNSSRLLSKIPSQTQKAEVTLQLLLPRHPRHFPVRRSIRSSPNSPRARLQLTANRPGVTFLFITNSHSRFSRSLVLPTSFRPLLSSAPLLNYSSLLSSGSISLEELHLSSSSQRSRVRYTPRPFTHSASPYPRNILVYRILFSNWSYAAGKRPWRPPLSPTD